MYVMYAQNRGSSVLGSASTLTPDHQHLPVQQHRQQAAAGQTQAIPQITAVSATSIAVVLGRRHQFGEPNSRLERESAT